jgi:hypothetical protein
VNTRRLLTSSNIYVRTPDAGNNYVEARSVARDLAEKNRKIELPDIEEELRVLFKRIKTMRTEARKTVFIS